MSSSIVDRIRDIREAYRCSQRAYHNYNDWESEQWDRIDEAERVALDLGQELNDLVTTLIDLEEKAVAEQRPISPGEWSKLMATARRLTLKERG